MPDGEEEPDLIALGEVFKSASIDAWRMPYFDEAGALQYSDFLFCPWEIEQFCFGNFAFCDTEPYLPWKDEEFHLYSTQPAEFILAMLAADIWGRVFARHADYVDADFTETGEQSGSIAFAVGGVA